MSCDNHSYIKGKDRDRTGRRVSAIGGDHMRIGSKAQGQDVRAKSCVMRHGHKRGASRRSYAAAEKAAETRVRQAGKKACKEND